ncbi:MAG: hypothetical protein AAFU65_14880, partial [Pseudomonadota bacterium]
NVRLIQATWRGNAQGGLLAQNGSLRLRDVAFVGNASDGRGGGLLASNVLLDIQGLIASANRSLVDGGALSVTGGTLRLTDAAFHGNAALGRGGALHVTAPRAQVSLSNVLFIGNDAPDGAAIFAAGAGRIDVANATAVAQRAAAGGHAFAVSDQASLSVHDSVVLDSQSGDQGGGHFGAGVASGFNSLDGQSSGNGDVLVDTGAGSFGWTYASRSGLQTVDNGSTPANAAGLADAFALDGRVYPDEGVVDRGYHYRRRPDVSAADRLEAVVMDGSAEVPAGPGEQSIAVRVFVNGRAVGTGYRVQVQLAGPGVARSAIDLADGRYGFAVPVGTASSDLGVLLGDDSVDVIPAP